MTQTQETPLIFILIVTGVEPDTRGGDPMTKAQHQPLFHLHRLFCRNCVCFGLSLCGCTTFEILQGDAVPLLEWNPLTSLPSRPRDGMVS